MSPENQTRTLEVTDLVRKFGAKRALDGVSFSAAPGQIVLLLGANGSGKTTLLRACAGLLGIDRGSIKISGTSIESVDFNCLGYAGHEPQLYDRLTLLENLKLHTKLRKKPCNISALLDIWKLTNVQNQQIDGLSKGQLQRAALIAAMLHDPQLLLLDEPSSNLDDSGCDALCRLVAPSESPSAASNKKLVVIATHDLARLSHLATRIIVLSNGTVSFDSGSSSTEQELRNAIEDYRDKNR